MSNPAGHDHPWSQARVRTGPGRRTRRPGGRRRPAGRLPPAASRRPTGVEGDVGVSPASAVSASPAAASGVGTDAARHARRSCCTAIRIRGLRTSPTAFGVHAPVQLSQAVPQRSQLKNAARAAPRRSGSCGARRPSRPGQGPGQGVGVARFDQYGPVPRTSGSYPARWPPPGHRPPWPQRGKSETLVQRRVGEDRRPLHKAENAVLHPPVRTIRAAAVRPDHGRRPRHPHPTRAGRPGPARGRRGRPRRSKARHQAGQVLARLGRADGEDVAPRPPRAAALDQPARRRGRQVGQRTVRRVHTTRTRAGSAPKASTTSSATKDEAVCTQAPRPRPGGSRRDRPGSPVAHLGVVQRRQVVDRHHRGRPGGWAAPRSWCRARHRPAR